MLHIKQREFTRQDAVKLVERMIRKGMMNYIIRDALMEKGFSVYQSNELIREVRKANTEPQNDTDHEDLIGYGLAIVTLIMLVIMLFLLIAPAQ